MSDFTRLTTSKFTLGSAAFSKDQTTLQVSEQDLGKHKAPRTTLGSTNEGFAHASTLLGEHHRQEVSTIPPHTRANWEHMHASERPGPLRPKKRAQPTKEDHTRAKPRDVNPGPTTTQQADSPQSPSAQRKQKTHKRGARQKTS